MNEQLLINELIEEFKERKRAKSGEPGLESARNALANIEIKNGPILLDQAIAAIQILGPENWALILVMVEKTFSFSAADCGAKMLKWQPLFDIETVKKRLEWLDTTLEKLNDGSGQGVKMLANPINPPSNNASSAAARPANAPSAAARPANASSGNQYKGSPGPQKRTPGAWRM